MQEESCENPVLPGRVNEIRKQWCVQEDEALAIRLQNEEITQHYSGNRSRNALVREDIPKAKAEQRKAEQDALEERMRQLQLRQQQAEADALLAKQLADRYEQGLETDNFSDVNTGAAAASAAVSSGAATSNFIKSPLSSPVSVIVPGPDGEGRKFVNNINLMHSPTGSYRSTSSNSNGGSNSGRDSVNHSGASSANSSTASASGSKAKKTTKSIMKTTSAYDRRSSSPLLGACALPPKSSSSEEDSSDLLEEERERIRQEQLDEELALRLQKELEQMEIDKRLALEAQDRELAKMIHQKDKDKLRRAKERAKAKAAAAASGSSETEDSIQVLPEGASGGVAAKYSAHHHNHNSNNIFANKFPEAAPVPPKIPEKTRVSTDDIVGFRAAPKALPPQPFQQIPEIRSNYFRNPQASTSYVVASTHLIPKDDPIPPYMPLQGLQNLSKKRHK